MKTNGLSRLSLHIWLIPGALYLASISLRYVLFWGVPPYGDEGGFYWFAGHPFLNPTNIHDLYFEDFNRHNPSVGYRPVPTFWYRPAHMLLLAPGAVVSFDAYRAINLALTALLPVFVFLYLRKEGIRRVFSVGGAVAVIVHPVVAAWSSYTLPDGLLATAFVAGMWLGASGRPAASAMALVTAAWVKETALVGIAMLFVVNIIRSGRVRGALWPLNVDRQATGLLIAFALGLIPTITPLVMGGPPPGALREPNIAALFDELTGSAWLLAILVAGLLRRSTRDTAIMGLAYPAFYALYSLGGRALNLWYFVVPNVLAIVAIVMILDRWQKEATPARGWRHHAVTVVAAVLVAVILAQAMVPSTPEKGWAVHPVSGLPQDSLLESARYEHGLEPDLWAMHDAISKSPGEDLFLVDVFQAYALYPLQTPERHVWIGVAGAVREFAQDLAPWIDAIENRTHLTIVAKTDEPLNRVIRDVYGDCAALDTPTYVLIDTTSCTGRGATLRSEYATFAGPRRAAGPPAG